MFDLAFEHLDLAGAAQVPWSQAKAARSLAQRGVEDGLAILDLDLSRRAVR